MIRYITIAGMLVLLILIAAFKKSPVTGEQKFGSVINKAKWKKLFDGKTFDGWHLYGRNYVGSSWKIDDGTLHVAPVTDRTQRGDLVTNEEYENFDLLLEWKV